ncbi:sugar porter family MFS transporter [uncultured Shewanella sp.]|uniref:sugar porter family MFS transporter n=1 Tax=uncultured Shewanella sp. TaxID=173975 RepID=UPI002639D07C|nr:sugar porter family MFS transporter [uncultured Shewanella sp.]
MDQLSAVHKHSTQISTNHSFHRSGNLIFVIFVCLISSLGGFLVGFDTGVINGTFDGLYSVFDNNHIASGFNVTAILLGGAVGALSSGLFVDRLGRRSMLIVAANFLVISAWGAGITDASIGFILYRMLGGVAIGILSVITPIYIAEIAPSRYRGTLISLQYMAILLGLLFASLSNDLLLNIAGKSTELLWLDAEAWRWMFWIELLPAFLFLFLLFFIPESPRFLAAIGNQRAAHEVLIKLHGQTKAASVVTKLKSTLPLINQPIWTDVLQTGRKKMKNVLWLALTLAALQQLMGINVIYYYGAVLWQGVGFSEADTLLINIITGMVSIAGCCLTLVFIDKCGRKPFLIMGSMGMTLTLGLIVYAFANAEFGLNGELNLGAYDWLALISANVYVFFFSLSWGPVIWTLLVEMFPQRIRGLGMALSGCTLWLVHFAMIRSFPFLLTELGLAQTYSLYCVFTLLSVVLILCCIHETKRQTLEDIHQFCAE